MGVSLLACVAAIAIERVTSRVHGLLCPVLSLLYYCRALFSPVLRLGLGLTLCVDGLPLHLHLDTADRCLHITKPALHPLSPSHLHPLPSYAGEKMVVVSDFTADNDSAISIRTGEFVWVDEKSDTGWWFVKKREGGEGWAPSDYLKLAGGIAMKPKPAAKKPITAAKP